MTKEELFDEIVAEAKRDGDIVGTATYMVFKVEAYSVAVRVLGDDRWEWRVVDTRDRAGGVEADVYTAIERGKEWIAHAKTS